MLRKTYLAQIHILAYWVGAYKSVPLKVVLWPSSSFFQQGKNFSNKFFFCWKKKTVVFGGIISLLEEDLMEGHNWIQPFASSTTDVLFNPFLPWCSPQWGPKEVYIVLLSSSLSSEQPCEVHQAERVTGLRSPQQASVALVEIQTQVPQILVQHS